MTSINRPFACATLLALFVAGVAAAEDKPAMARLTLNSESYNVPLGKPFAIRLGGEKLTLRIDLQDEQTFSEAGVTFRYPTGFEASDAAPSGGVTIWTLQGQSAAIMLQRYDGELDAKSLRQVLVDNLVEQSGGEQQAVKLTGAKRAYQGVQLRSSSPGEAGSPATQSVQNVFTFANAEGVFALVVQDVRPPGEKDSKEYGEALRLLGESLATGKPPAPKPAPEAEAAGTR
ncbi:hypothetical protein MalM25_22810 [Planctomycetes bacterium MalM25]|nr:hypothetical protein MalM25_22810 [Planctomycetes bacterium MalM25]